MATAREVINAGYLDRMISQLANVGKGQIRGNNADLAALRLRLSAELGPSPLTSGRGLREVWEQARLAVNRARRLEAEGGTLPPLASVGAAESASGVAAARLEVTVIVELANPETGGTARFPVVVQTTGRLTHQQIASLASAASTTGEHWRDSGRRGDNAMENAVPIDVLVIGIIGRS